MTEGGPLSFHDPHVWALLGGRNRQEACRRAGVEPWIEETNEGNPAALILSNNVKRRHLNKGQQALATVLVCEVTSHTDSVRVLAERAGTSSKLIDWAKGVAVHADLSAEVMAASKQLKEAYKEAQDRQRSQQGNAALLAQLQREAPDLAARVTEQGMRLNEAMAARDAAEQSSGHAQDSRLLLAVGARQRSRCGHWAL